MAVRSGAGTGVVVSLVVFVLTTVFLLVLSIVFYAGKTKEIEARTAAANSLGEYIRSAERNNDQFKAVEAAAKDNRQSVTGYLISRQNEIMEFLGADPRLGLDGVRNEFRRFNFKDTDTVRGRLTTLTQDLNARQLELDGMNAQVRTLSEQIAGKDAQIAQLKAEHQQELDSIEGLIAGYRDSAETYRTQMQTAVDDLNRAKDSLRTRYEGRIRELENETDNLNRDLVTLRGKIAEFEKARDAARIKSQDPATLVDGQIIDVPSTSDEIYINRGKKDRIVLGMTFEVFGDKSQIRPHPQTGELPRGKASLQVTKVNDTTSICKLTRMTPGNPVIRNDVIANAVYDPTYRFKFLVHGKFDIDADGKPTETEADYLRSLVVDWGGTIVTGTELPGDLDFLVLGVEPPAPPPPADSASAVQFNAWLQQNEAHQLYRRLFNNAQQAQIPVLNANRFFILIGYTER